MRDESSHPLDYQDLKTSQNVQTGDTLSVSDKGDISMARGVVCWSCGVSFAHKGAICAVVRGTDAIFQMGVCSGRL